MATQNQLKISDAEWEIMRVLWTLEVADAKAIHQLLSSSMDWKLATVKTLLGRLVTKGAIQPDNVGKKFIYRPLVWEQEMILSASESLFTHVCAKKMGQTLGAIIQDVALTQADIQDLLTILSKKVAVSEILCDCIPGQCTCKKEGEK
ncbi:MAG: CopY/TcrY family copper transport repressor [Enterococcus sp.]